MRKYFLIIVCLLIVGNSFAQKSSLEELGKAAADAFEQKKFKAIQALMIPKASFIKLGEAAYEKVLKERGSPDLIEKIDDPKYYKSMMDYAKTHFSIYMNWYDDYEIEFDDFQFIVEKREEGALNSEIVVAYTNVTSPDYNYFFVSAVKYEDSWYLSALPEFESVNKYNNFKLTENSIFLDTKMAASGKIDYRYHQLPSVHNCLSTLMKLKNVSSSERDNYTSAVITGRFSANLLHQPNTKHPMQHNIYIKYEIQLTHNQINLSFYEHRYEKDNVNYVLDSEFTPEMAKNFTKEEFQTITTELKDGYELFFIKIRNYLVEFAEFY